MSPIQAKPEPYTIVLGNNDITNCEAALVIEGEEVFRIREDEGRLLVDCDVLDLEDRRIAKIVRNTVIYAAPGFRAHGIHGCGRSSDAGRRVADPRHRDELPLRRRREGLLRGGAGDRHVASARLSTRTRSPLRSLSIPSA